MKNQAGPPVRTAIVSANDVQRVAAQETSMQDAKLLAIASGRLRPIWISTQDLQPGMVIAESVQGVTGGYATLKISAGCVLSEETIVQLVVKGIECVAIVNPTPLPEQDYDAACKAYEARLREIFGEPPAPDCLALMNALLARGPSQWQ
jgi:hypothetical protein